MKRNILYMAAAVAGTLGLASCDLDEYNPSGGDANIQAVEGWTGLENYCYSPLAEQLYTVYDFMSVAEGGTDMWLTPGSNPDYAKELIYYQGLTINTNGSNKTFKQVYSCVASCNAVINHADEVSGLSDEDKKVLVAEAKTLRAFYNLTLVTYYGPVTLVTNEPDDPVLKPQRNTVEEFYTSITTDLKEAAADLGVQPKDGNYARVCKKTALGLLARAYAQGAGEGLQENGVSYWQRAKEVAEDIINNASSYNVYLYPDVDELWAQANNRNNKEALFTASGRDGNKESYNFVNCNNNLFGYMMCNPYKLPDLYQQSDKQNYYLGRTNNCTLAPSLYTIYVFDPSWDKRWENTFMTAFGQYSMVGPAWVAYDKGKVQITQEMVDKYGMGQQFVGDYIYPYIDLNTNPSTYGGNQYFPAGIWPKGEHSGDQSKLIKGDALRNVYAIDSVAEDDDRFNIVMTRAPRTKEEKAKSRYFTLYIKDLFDADGQYKRGVFDGTNSYRLFPSFIKYDWCYDGVVGGNLQRKNGDMMIMRTAEVYLIAAEACQQLGDEAGARKYLKPLRDRAARTGVAPELGAITEETIFDEYAREMCGEFERFALLKRHHKLGERLRKYNTRAAQYFDENVHYNRPISSDFLEQIENKDEYGDNGYGTTPSKGF